MDFGGGVSGFPIESVIATIEVKSDLDQAAIDQPVSAANNVKELIQHITRSFSSGWRLPKILNYVVAYTGTSQDAELTGPVASVIDSFGEGYKSFRVSR